MSEKYLILSYKIIKLKIKRNITFSCYLEILGLHSTNPTNAACQNSQQDQRQVLVKQLTLSKLDSL